VFIDVARKQISRLTEGMSFLSVAITLRLEQKNNFVITLRLEQKKLTFLRQNVAAMLLPQA
jgi:hypothetical protein